MENLKFTRSEVLEEKAPEEAQKNAQKIELVREETVVPSMVELDGPFDTRFKIKVYIENYTGTVFAGYGIETKRKVVRLAEKYVDFENSAAYMIVGPWSPPPPTTRDLLRWWLETFKEDYIPKKTSTIRFFVICGDKVDETYRAWDYQLYEVMVEVPEIPWEKILMGGALCVGAGAILYGISR